MNVAEEEVRPTDTAVISKLNPTAKKFVPGPAKPAANGRSPLKKPPVEDIPLAKSIPLAQKPKKIRQRNIALESIFQAMESHEPNREQSNDEALTLLKPKDFILNVNIDTKVKSEAVEKVNDWMTHMLSPIKTKPEVVILDSSNMFKKKKKLDTSKPCVDIDPSAMFKRKDLQRSKVCVDKPPSPGVAAFVPSARAAHFYQQYVEKSRLRDALHDDIWTKAEKQMKHIDEKK